MNLRARAAVASLAVHVVALLLLSREPTRTETIRTRPIEVELTFRTQARRSPAPAPQPAKSTSANARRTTGGRTRTPVPLANEPAPSLMPEGGGERGPPGDGAGDAGVSGDEGEPLLVEDPSPPPPPPPTEPALLALPQIEYPPSALLNEIEGVVRLEVLLARDGSVCDVQVLESPSPELARAAIAALRAAQFRPATRGGQPVESRFSYRYRFELR